MPASGGMGTEEIVASRPARRHTASGGIMRTTVPRVRLLAAIRYEEGEFSAVRPATAVPARTG